MSRTSRGYRPSLPGDPDAQRGRDWPPAAEYDDYLPGNGMLIAGVALLALGALAWYSFGPDVQRYLKIRNM